MSENIPEPIITREMSFSPVGNPTMGYSVFLEYKDAYTQVAMPLSLDRFIEAMEHVLRHLPPTERSKVLRKLNATERDR